MSYDFHLFQAPAGVDATMAYHRQLEEKKIAKIQRAPGMNKWGQPDPVREETKHRLATALIACHPGLQLFRRDYAKVALAKSISEDEARRRYRDLELSDEELGLQVTLFDDTASVSIAFGTSEAHSAELRLGAAWECLRLLEREGGFSTYDPQIGKILRLDTDFQTALRMHNEAGQEMQRTLTQRPM